MKKIILIGDSIRVGYDKYVKDALKDEAEVFYPPENCRFAQYVLRAVSDWRRDGKWGNNADLVHWNAGLWDTLRLYGDDPLTPPEMYGIMIKRIDKRLRLLFPNAKMVFATSTRVLEHRYGNDFKRYNRDIEEYNRIAVEALKDTDTVINDLYSLTANLPDEYYSDVTHLYTPEGTNAMTNKVLDVICEELGFEKINYDSNDYHKEAPVGI
ncbi:MAG: SGNH/GDSL hydrolase family protein [Clostridia bacterium]|nr:SGNH/GDSL hydrolase family protein [Clostridia bacterium]